MNTFYLISVLIKIKTIVINTDKRGDVISDAHFVIKY